jgi:hypothetical protein
LNELSEHVPHQKYDQGRHHAIFQYAAAHAQSMIIAVRVQRVLIRRIG